MEQTNARKHAGEKASATRDRNNVEAGRKNAEQDFGEILNLVRSILKVASAEGTKELLQEALAKVNKNPGHYMRP